MGLHIIRHNQPEIETDCVKRSYMLSDGLSTVFGRPIGFEIPIRRLNILSRFSMT